MRGPFIFRSFDDGHRAFLWLVCFGCEWNDRALTEDDMTKVIVTGGSGKLGRAVLKDLVANGY